MVFSTTYNKNDDIEEELLQLEVRRPAPTAQAARRGCARRRRRCAA
eukprot:COSAG02_NODE_885_length_16178_cov_80.571677_2_plen_46_part_00